MCKSRQTFRGRNSSWSSQLHSPFGSDPGYWSLLVVTYECASCEEHARYFILKVTDDSKAIMKVGQAPAWSVEVEPEVAKALGEHLPEFKKGLINESQSYGIGAFAYYRRIIEKIIDKLLNDILYFLPDEKEQEAFRKALEQLKGDNRAEKKIEAVKDVLPAVLRPGGMNPLSTLHSALSEGLHAKSDEECLEDATAIRVALKYLIEQVTRTKDNASSYAASMKALQEKQAKRSGKGS